MRVYKRTHAKAKRAWAGRGRAGRRRHANEVRGKRSDGGAPGAVKASLVLSSAQLSPSLGASGNSAAPPTVTRECISRVRGEARALDAAYVFFGGGGFGISDGVPGLGSTWTAAVNCSPAEAAV